MPKLRADDEDNWQSDTLLAHVLALDNTSDPLCWHIVLERLPAYWETAGMYLNHTGTHGNL